eukprot:1158840-Pelagomonas_calceolata.AAC.8
MIRKPGWFALSYRGLVVPDGIKSHAMLLQTDFHSGYLQLLEPFAAAQWAVEHNIMLLHQSLR